MGIKWVEQKRQHHIIFKCTYAFSFLSKKKRQRDPLPPGSFPKCLSQLDLDQAPAIRENSICVFKHGQGLSYLSHHLGACYSLLISGSAERPSSAIWNVGIPSGALMVQQCVSHVTTNIRSFQLGVFTRAQAGDFTFSTASHYRMTYTHTQFILPTNRIANLHCLCTTVWDLSWAMVSS